MLPARHGRHSLVLVLWPCADDKVLMHLKRLEAISKTVIGALRGYVQTHMQRKSGAMLTAMKCKLNRRMYCYDQSLRL